MAITRRNYTPGQYEAFTGEPVGTPVLNTPTAFKLDGLFSFDVADDVILIQGGSAIPTTAYELLTDNLYTAKEAGYSGLTVVKMFKITNATYAGIATTASGKNFGSAVDNDILWGLKNSEAEIKTAVTNTKRPAIDKTVIPHFIGEEYENLILSGCNLTDGWVNVASSDELTAMKVDDHTFTKAINLGGVSVGYIYQDKTDTFDNLILSGMFTTRRGSESSTFFSIQNKSQGYANLFNLTINFNDHTTIPTTSFGEVLEYKWLDEDTVRVHFKTESLTALTDDVRVRVNSSMDTVADAYTYWSEVQLIDEAGTTMFPYVDGTHEADVITVEQTLPDKFTFDIEIDPKIDFVSASNVIWFRYLVSTAYFTLMFYGNYIRVRWTDGTNLGQMLATCAMDDGTDYLSFNQKIRVIGSFDLVNGDSGISRLIVMPLESGGVYETTSWNLTPDIKTTDFPTLSIGSTGDAAYSNSEFNKFRLYDALLVGDVTSFEDSEKLLQDMPLIFEAIPDAFIPVEISEETEVSSAIQQMNDSFKNGTGIADGALQYRHLSAELKTLLGI